MATTLHIEGDRVFTNKENFETMVNNPSTGVTVDGVTYYYEPTKYKYYVVAHYYNSDEVDTLLTTKLDKNQGSENADKALIVNSSGEVSVRFNPDLMTFVDSLPLTNIDEKKQYLVKNNNIFPECASIATSSNYLVVVTYSANDGYKLLYIQASSNTGVISSTNYWGNIGSYIYKTYHASNGFWVLDYDSETASNACWNAITWADTIYSNYKVINSYWGSTFYDNANNTTDIYGVPLNSGKTYSYKAYQFVNNAWVFLGIVDFEKLIKPIDDAIDGKVEANQGSSNVGKVMQVGVDGNLTPADLGIEVTYV